MEVGNKLKPLPGTHRHRFHQRISESLLDPENLVL